MMEIVFENIHLILLQSVISVIVAFLVLMILKSNTFQCAYRSPGPWGVPILGYYPFLPKTDQHLHLMKLSRKYGDAYILSLLGKRYLHLSSSKAVQEVFVTKSEHFSEVTRNYNLFTELFKDGILSMNGESWRVWKKYLLQSMKEISLGTKDRLKNSIQNATSAIIKQLQETANEPVNITSLLYEQSAEVIKKLMLGDDISIFTIPKLNYLFSLMTILSTDFKNLLSGKMARCICKYKLKHFDIVREAKEEICDIFKSLINEHEQNLDMNNPKNMIDLYLREYLLKIRRGDTEVKYFTDKAFIDILITIPGYGFYIIEAIVAHCLYKLAKLDDVQQAMFTEISENIEDDILPSYEDRMKLPYTNSVIKELMRTFDVFGFVPGLECTEDTTISGTFVPKGTIVMINLHAVSNDEAVYKFPKKFAPERFLSPEDGQSSSEDILLTLGIGKGLGLGETQVSTEIFLFITAIIQRFKIELPHLKDEDAVNGGATEDETKLFCLKDTYITATLRTSLTSTLNEMNTYDTNDIEK